MADLYSTSLELSVLMAGRGPAWEQQPDSGSLLPPSSASSGVYLEGAVRTLVHVSLREQAHRRTVRLTIPSGTLTGTYTVTVMGTAVTYNATAGAPANVAALVDAIAAAIAANGTAAGFVTATGVAASGSGAHDTVLLRGVGEADYGIDFSHSGAATLLVVADPCRAEMRLWWFGGAQAGITPPQIWAASPERWDLDRRGILQRLDSAGLDRLHVQVSDRRGHSGDGSAVTYAAPAIGIGPCLAEVT